MKDIRIGNDIIVKWSIFGDGAPYILEGKDVSLYLCTPFGKRKAEGFSIVDNQITWTFAGKDQSRTGKYSLELVVNADKEGQVTTDVCNFVNLVNCSCKVGGTDESNVEIESISLTSELGFLPYDDAELREAIATLEREKVDKEEGKGLSSNDYTDEEKEKNVVASFLNGKSLQGLPFGYVGGTYQSYQFDGEVNDEIDLGVIKEAYYGNIAFSYEDKLYEFKIQDLKGEGATLGTILVRVTNDNHLIVKPFAPRVALLGWRTYGDRTKMPSAWVEGGGSGGGSYDDTGIKNDISDLKAKDTEHDAELAKLSERIDNLPTAESEVFVAEYGKTTYADIVKQYNEGKLIYCSYQSYSYVLTSIIDSVGLAYFYSAGIALAALVCNRNGKWSQTSHNTDHKLETLEDGNVKVTIAGKSAEVATPQYVDEKVAQSGGGMTTPSGDPMHYMFEAAGATYNATDADIPMVGVYGDSYVHKAKHWHLNELGDITNEEMRAIYVESNPMVRRINLEDAFSDGTIRTNIAIWDANRKSSYGNIAHTSSDLRGVCLDAQIEVFSFIVGPQDKNIHKHHVFSANSLSCAFRGATKVSKIIGVFNCQNPTDYKTFENTHLLKEVRLLNLKNSFTFAESPLLSKNSVLFAIQKSIATSAITITLHADAYARLAEDADIVAALTEKEFVSLASA